MSDRTAGQAAAGADLVVTALCAAAWIVAFAAIWIPELPAGRDIPAHAMAAAVWANPSAFSDWLTPNVPLSGNVFAVIAGLAAKVIGVTFALKFALTISVLACAAGTARLASVVGTDPRVASVVGLSIGCGWLFGMGFASFVTGTGVALLAASYALEDEPRLRHVAVLFVAAVWCHLMASGIVFAAILAARTLTRSRVPRLRWLAAWAPGLALALGVGLSGILGQSSAGVSTASEWGTFSEWCRDLALTSLTSFDVRFGWVAGIAVVVLAVGATAKSWSRAVEGAADGFLRSGIVWWALLALVPLNGLGWHFARPRMMPMAVLLPLAFIVRRGDRKATFIMAPLLIGLLGTLVGSLDRGAEVASVAAELRADSPSGETFLASYLDLSAEHDGPYVQPFVGVAGYGMMGGGAGRHLFAHNAAAHAMLYREDVEFPSAAPHFIHVSAECVADDACSGGAIVRADRLALAGLNWDSIAVAGLDEEERAYLLARGYLALAPGLLQPQHSRIRVAAEVPPDLAEFPVVVRYGYESTGVVGGGSALAEDGRVEIEIGPLLAGATVVEAFFDRDGDGTPSGADAALFDAPRMRVNVPVAEVLVLGR